MANGNGNGASGRNPRDNKLRGLKNVLRDMKSLVEGYEYGREVKDGKIQVPKEVAARLSKKWAVLQDDIAEHCTF